MLDAAGSKRLRPKSRTKAKSNLMCRLAWSSSAADLSLSGGSVEVLREKHSQGTATPDEDYAALCREALEVKEKKKKKEMRPKWSDKTASILYMALGRKSQVTGKLFQVYFLAFCKQLLK